MLKKINAIYFIRIIFMHFKEGRKLKIIKYTKSLQNTLNIKLINYKYFSKKYIIYEENGKGKEYDGHYDTLIFEGEYLNGERNGKGKEYYGDGKLKFEGEYLYGQEWEGKGYNFNNKVKDT